MSYRWILTVGIGATFALTACGGDNGGASDTATPAASPTAGASGSATPDAGGKIILVEMETDAAGVNKFEPATFEANRGDVIRYTLISGVHNVHFLADSNPGKTGLPAASAMLQLPHQTHDIKVTLSPGRYYFQCDPHALLGMIGPVTV
jgi:plastocyanin